MTTSVFSAIQRNARQRGATLATLVYDVIKDAIVSGKVKPGEWLPAQRDLEVQLQVSRSPIRDALSKLQSEGLLAPGAGGGFIVADAFEELFASPLNSLIASNPQVRFDILELRRLLEGAAAFYAAKRSTPEEHHRLQELYESLKWAYTEGTLKDAATADAKFHLAIIEAAHNQAILSVMNNFYTFLQDSVLDAADTIRRDRDNWNETDRHHRELLNAIVEGNAERAQMLAYEHLGFLHTKLSLAKPLNI